MGRASASIAAWNGWVEVGDEVRSEVICECGIYLSRVHTDKKNYCLDDFIFVGCQVFFELVPCICDAIWFDDVCLQRVPLRHPNTTTSTYLLMIEK